MSKYGESLFGVEPPKDPLDGERDEEDDDGGDIEAAIEKELESIKEEPKKPKERGAFTPVSTGLECLFFMKTARPIDALRLTQEMCRDAGDCPDPRGRKTKYINRLTPIQDMDKATEKGIERVARSILAQSFELKSEEGQGGKDGQDGQDGQDAGAKAESPACTVCNSAPWFLFASSLLREADESVCYSSTPSGTTSGTTPLSSQAPSFRRLLAWSVPSTRSTWATQTRWYWSRSSR